MQVQIVIGSVETVCFMYDLDGMTERDGWTVDNIEREEEKNHICSCMGTRVYANVCQQLYSTVCVYRRVCLCECMSD